MTAFSAKAIANISASRVTELAVRPVANAVVPAARNTGARFNVPETVPTMSVALEQPDSVASAQYATATGKEQYLHSDLDEVTCSRCQGSGQATCGTCKGRGIVPCDVCSATGQLRCVTCLGDGKVQAYLTIQQVFTPKTHDAAATTHPCTQDVITELSDQDYTSVATDSADGPPQTYCARHESTLRNTISEHAPYRCLYREKGHTHPTA